MCDRTHPRRPVVRANLSGGGVISYYAVGRQLVAIASGMKSSVWPGAAQHSRILVFGLC